MLVAQADVLKAEGRSSRPRATISKLPTNWTPSANSRNAIPASSRSVTSKSFEVLQAGRQGALDSATASNNPRRSAVTALLPTEKASAEAALAEGAGGSGQDLYSSGVDGRVEQFRVAHGDIVNPMITVGRRSYSGTVRGQTLSAGFWTNRSSGHEGWNGCGGLLHLKALDDYSDGGDERCRITSPRASSGVASNWSKRGRWWLRAPFSRSWNDLQRRPDGVYARKQLHRPTPTPATMS